MAVSYGPDTDGEESPPYDRAPSPWAVWMRLGRIESDIRSIKQTQDETVIPELKEQGEELKTLRSRFVYALTIIGTAVGTIAYLVVKGGLPL